MSKSSYAASERKRRERERAAFRRAIEKELSRMVDAGKVATSCRLETREVEYALVETIS